MTSIKYAPGAQAFSGSSAGDEPLIRIVETPLSGVQNNVGSVDRDVGITTTTTTGATNNYKIEVTLSAEQGYARHAFVNNAPAVATVNAQGQVAMVIPGTSDITVIAPPSVRRITRALASGGTVVTTSWASWTAGSLAKHVEDAILAMIGVNSPGAATQAVLSSTSGGHTAPNHIRNSSIFTGALDLTAISVYGEEWGSNILPVVLISPRHVMAGHAGARPGKAWVFKDLAGNYQVRTVTAQAKLSPDWGDNYVGLLDSQITTITPWKTLPANWASYLPCEDHSPAVGYLPVLNKGFQAGDWIRVLGWYGTPVTANPYPMYLQPHNRSPFTAWTSPTIPGDSNGPVFLPINGAPVLLHCMNYTYGGSFYPARAVQIQAAMDALLPGYALGTANLSTFPTY